MSIERRGNGYTLSGGDAEAFARQMDQPAPEEARRAVRIGAEMVREMKRTGRVRLKLKTDKAPRFTDRYNQR